MKRDGGTVREILSRLTNSASVNVSKVNRRIPGQ